MKRIILSLLLASAAPLCLQAQQVYTQIKQKATQTASDPQADDAVRQISRFKVNALDYMAMKMKEQMPDSAATLLDRQALAMSNFVSLYVQTLLDIRSQPQAYQLKVMRLFIDASLSNPLFNDHDTDLVHSYVASENSLTRFSIDTDWPRAYIAVSTTLKKGF